MLWELRDFAPVLLVPSAWLAAAGAHFGLLGETGIFIAHLVMAGFIAFFATTGWTAMADGALRAWRTVLVVGLGVTLAGIGGFLVSDFETALWTVSLVGWMLLPGAGLLYTAREIPEAKLVYGGGGALSVVGALVYLGTFVTASDLLVVISISAVGLGHTAGIVEASRAE